MAGARILVVEDESIVAKDIQASLRGLGYTVPAIVSSGEEALVKAVELQPDLVLMDIMLKGTLDGIETAKLINSRHKMPVVYLTAFTDEVTLKRAKVSDAFGYLIKPFEDRELRTTIEMALYKHSMERQLHESREWLNITLRSITDAVLATDAEGRIEFVNPVAERLLGRAHDEAIGQPLAEVLRIRSEPEGLIIDLSPEAMKTGADRPPGGAGETLVTFDGKLLPIEHGVSAIRDEVGQVKGVVVIFRDITARRQAEDRERRLQERLFRSKRMESIGILAGGVANDLNNILGPIIGYPDLILKAIGADHAARADLDIIRNSAQKAIDIVRDLLTLGRIGHFPTEPLDLNLMAEACLKSGALAAMRQRSPLVTVESHLAPDLRPVLASDHHIQEMILNLIAHAFNTMPEGGKLILTTSLAHVATPQQGYETIEPGTYAVIHVSDTGAGIPEDDLGRIFEPFYIKRKLGYTSGSGLGLSVVYGVVKEYRGFIDVQSHPGHGTVFTVYIPVTGPVAEPVARPAASKDIRGTEAILVVDDDEEQRRFAARALRSVGYRVVTAPNGRSALELLDEEFRASGVRIDLVLLDMILADVWDGLDTYKRMAEKFPHQKAVLVGGFAVTGRIRETMRLGAGHYLQKPFTADELGKAIRAELDKTPVGG